MQALYAIMLPQKLPYWGKRKRYAIYFYIVRHQKVNTNGIWGSIYLLNKCLQIWYTLNLPAQLLNKFPSFYGTWWLTIEFIRSLHSPLPSVRWFQSTNHFLRPILILPSHLYQDLSYWWYASLILLYFSTLILFDEQYKKAPHYALPIFSALQ